MAAADATLLSAKTISYTCGTAPTNCQSCTFTGSNVCAVCAPNFVLNTATPPACVAVTKDQDGATVNTLARYCVKDATTVPTDTAGSNFDTVDANHGMKCGVCVAATTGFCEKCESGSAPDSGICKINAGMFIYDCTAIVATAARAVAAGTAVTCSACGNSKVVSTDKKTCLTKKTCVTGTEIDHCTTCESTTPAAGNKCTACDEGWAPTVDGTACVHALTCGDSSPIKLKNALTCNATTKKPLTCLTGFTVHNGECEKSLMCGPNGKQRKMWGCKECGENDATNCKTVEDGWTLDATTKLPVKGATCNGTVVPGCKTCAAGTATTCATTANSCMSGFIEKDGACVWGVLKDMPGCTKVGTGVATKCSVCDSTYWIKDTTGTTDGTCVQKVQCGGSVAANDRPGCSDCATTPATECAACFNPAWTLAPATGCTEPVTTPTKDCGGEKIANCKTCVTEGTEAQKKTCKECTDATFDLKSDGTTCTKATVKDCGTAKIAGCKTCQDDTTKANQCKECETGRTLKSDGTECTPTATTTTTTTTTSAQFAKIFAVVLAFVLLK